MNPSLIECIFGDQIFKYQSLRAPRKEVQVKSLGSSQAGSKEEEGGGSQHGASLATMRGEILSQRFYTFFPQRCTTIMLSGSKHHQF